VQALPGCDAGQGYSPGQPVRHVLLTSLTLADELIEQACASLCSCGVHHHFAHLVLRKDVVNCLGALRRWHVALGGPFPVGTNCLFNRSM
jgi:hypothetical protein